MTERKTYSFPAYVHVLIAFTAVFVLISIAYSFLVARHMSTVYFSQLEAAEEIKFEATTAHLWFEEIVSGDRHTSMDKVIEHIDSADWFAGAMIEGGENEHGKFFPLADPVMKQKIQEVRNELAEFKRITLKRWKMIETSGTGTSIDQEYDALFNRFILLAVEVEINLKSLITSKSNTFHKILILVFIISIALFLITALILRFHSLRRKRAEESLMETEARLSNLVENMPIVCFTYDREGRILSWNRAAEQVYGYSKDEAIGSSTYDLIVTPETLEATKEVVNGVFEGNTFENNEWQDRNKQGQVGWRFGNTFPLLKADGYVDYGVNFNVDITERKQAEMALAESEEKYRTIVDNVHAGIAKTNLKGELLFANKTLLDISGYESFEEMASSNILDSYINSGDRDAFIEKLKKDGKVDNFHLDLKNKDGQPITVLINAILKDNEITNMLVDITNLKKAEEALRESEEKYREFIEGTDDLITKVDSEGNFLFVNHMSKKIFGLSPEECIGRSAFLFVHQEDREKTNEWFNDLISRRADTGKIENRQVSVDGSISYLLWTTNLHYNKDGKVIYINSIASNITERKKAENALIESEAKFKRLSNLAPVGVYLTDPDGKCIYVNEKWLAMAGITFKDALGDGWMDGIHLDDRSKVFASWNKMVQSMGELSLEYRFLNRQTNKASWVHGTATKILDSSDRVIGYIGANMDITERKKAEDELRKISNQLQTNVSRMPIGYIMWDKEFKVEEWNYAAQEIFGYAKEEMLGRSPLDTIVPEEVRHLVTEVMNRLLSGADEVNYSEGGNNIRKDGKIISCTWHNTPLKDSEGNISGVLSMVLDITERKKAEEKVVLSLREKEVLLREVHHRVKNNMAVISSLLYLQSSYFDDAKYLDMFNESQSRIKSMALVHEKLYQSEDFAYIDVKDYIHSLVDSARDAFGSSSEVDTKLRIQKVNLDMDTLIPCGLIINEVLTNAFKHAFNGHDNPEIRVSLKKLKDDNISLVISDNGKGLPEDFDIQKSRGMGLRLIKILSKQIKSSLKVDGRDGTTFRFVFPEKLEFKRVL